jgi:arylsulfatase A-like enzyme
VLLQQQGVYSHLISDHYHYFEDGGWTYHQRYSSFEFIRGQEADKWKAMVQPPLERLRERYHPIQIDETRQGFRLQNLLNREAIREEHEFPAVRCFEQAIAFLDENRDHDDWFLQIETFDPHEPFTAPERFRKDYPTNYGGPILDWPRYREVEESPDEIAELRANYAALVAMCDHYVGRLLDYMDRYDLWKDTALVMTTDHGFMLAEHDWWGKNRMPFYDEIARIPLMIWHPDHAASAGRHVGSLTQCIDLMPTFLQMFGVDVPGEVQGRSLLPLLDDDVAIRDAAIYGIFGGATNVTDGRYTYFRYPRDLFGQEIFEYTLFPVHMTSFFTPAEFEGAELTHQFDFTKGLPMMRLPARRDAKRPPAQGGGFEQAVTVLYDTDEDPGQIRPLQLAQMEDRLCALMLAEMRAHDAPAEAFTRLDFQP